MVSWPALPRAMTLHGAGKASTLMHPSGTLAPCTPAQMDLSQEHMLLHPCLLSKHHMNHNVRPWDYSCCKYPDVLCYWHRNEVKAWRAEDIEQRVLNNAFLLWERYAESNRRFVEERAEQLKSFANLAALIAGFAIVSFLQVSAFCCMP